MRLLLNAYYLLAFSLIHMKLAVYTYLPIARVWEVNEYFVKNLVLLAREGLEIVDSCVFLDCIQKTCTGIVKCVRDEALKSLREFVLRLKVDLNLDVQVKALDYCN